MNDETDSSSAAGFKTVESAESFQLARRNLLKMLGATASLVAVPSAYAQVKDDPVSSEAARAIDISGAMGYWALPGDKGYQRMSAAWASGYRTDAAVAEELRRALPILPASFARASQSSANFMVRVLGIDGNSRMLFAELSALTVVDKQTVASYVWGTRNNRASAPIRFYREMSHQEPLVMQLASYYGRQALRTEQFVLPAAPGVYAVGAAGSQIDWSQMALVQQSKHGPLAYRIVDTRTGNTPQGLQCLVMTVSPV